MKKCYIFSAGSYYGLKELPRAGDIIIAADAGLIYCLREGLSPDLVVGDFDSSKRPDNLENVITLPVEKDDTDTLYAARKGLEMGCAEFHLYGAAGGERPDHTLANLQVLLFLAENGARGYIYDRSWVYTAIKNSCLEINRTMDLQTVSVFCPGADAHGVNLRGFKYPLKNGTLTADYPIGVSNHITEEKAAVSVEDGMLLIMYET